MLAASSTYTSFAKLLTGTFSPLSLVVISELLTGGFIIFSVGLFPVIREFFLLPRRILLSLLAVGLLSGIAAPILIFTGIHSTGAVNATLFGNTEMLFLLLLAVAFLGERLKTGHIFSLCAIALGIIFISFRGFTSSLTLQHGDALLILASLSYAFGDLVFRRFLAEIPTHTIILGRSIVAITGLTIIAFFLHISPLQEASTLPISLLPVLLGFAFVSRLLNIFCFYQSLERLPVSTVSTLSNLTVISAIAFAAWFLGEPIYAYQLVGGTFILFGTAMLELVGEHHPSEEHQIAHLRQRQVQRA